MRSEDLPSREPTGDECNANAYVEEIGAFATWYPQMGGFAAKCWIFASGIDVDYEEDKCVPGGCFDAVIYHDGEFPINQPDRRGRKPAILHHCDSEQFVDFGTTVRSFCEQQFAKSQGADTVEKANA